MTIPSLETLEKTNAAPKPKLWVSWEEFAGLSQKLANMIVHDRVKDGYVRPEDTIDELVFLARGGMDVCHILARRLGYEGPRLHNFGIKTYENEGTKQTGRVEFGQIPHKRDIEGKRIMMVDEVCETGQSLVVATDYLLTELGALSVSTGVIHYKPASACIKPDYYVSETDRWVVYPYEPENIPVHPDAHLLRG